jgi:hypothetical protein
LSPWYFLIRCTADIGQNVTNTFDTDTTADYELLPEPRRSLPLGSYAIREYVTNRIDPPTGAEPGFALEQGSMVDEDSMDLSNQAPPITRDNGSGPIDSIPSTPLESTSTMLQTPAVSQSLFTEETKPNRAPALTNESSDSPKDLSMLPSLGTLESNSEVTPSPLGNSGESLVSPAPTVTTEGSNFGAVSVLSDILGKNPQTADLPQETISEKSTPDATSAIPNTSSRGLEMTDTSQPLKVEGSRKDPVALPTTSSKTPESPATSQAQVTKELDSVVTHTFHDTSSTSLETPATLQAPVTEQSNHSVTRTPSNPSINSPQTSAASQALVIRESIITSTPAPPAESHGHLSQAKEKVAEQMVLIHENNGMKVSKKNIPIKKLRLYLKQRSGWVIGFTTSKDFRTFKTLPAENLIKHIQTKTDARHRYYCFKEAHYIKLHSRKAKPKPSQGGFLQEVDPQPQDMEMAREDQEGSGIETHESYQVFDEDIGCKHLTLPKTI